MKYTIILIYIFLWSSFCFSQTLKTPTLSPFSKISQEIGLTEVNLEYSRPSAKGRVIFDGLVPYDKIWRTGANASTKITLIESVYIGGKFIQPGTYALYTIPGKDVWTIIIHSNTKLRSLAGDAYNPVDDVFRFNIKSQRINHYVETFTIQFSDLKTNSFHLQLVWENTLVNIPIEVEVDRKIEEQMTAFMKDSKNISHRTYFEAAQYYLNNNKDLDEAIIFIDAALEKSPENFRYGLLKAKILNKGGDSQAALITINEAYNWAKKAKNDNYIEQTELFRQSLLNKK
ncbi:MAG: DUF2911 domain-containing protein [Bacteroidota bacterium]